MSRADRNMAAKEKLSTITNTDTFNFISIDNSRIENLKNHD